MTYRTSWPLTINATRMYRMQKDTLYSQPLSAVEDFRFDQRVANVFPDMIQRSVPGYSAMIALIGVIADQYAQPNSNIYDLGCSLGAASMAIRHRLTAPGCTLLAVDNSADMLAKAQSFLGVEDSPIPVQFVEADIRNLPIENASVVVLNFTLQFVPPDDRATLIQRIYRGMRPGGILLLSEKIAFDPSQSTLQNDLHIAFKKAQGYSDLEISQKRSALENVMRLDSVADHLARLRTAGFQQTEVWYQCLNFQSMLAIK